MGRFYFQWKNGEELTPDEEGSELPDVEAARREAVHSVRELLAHAIKVGEAKVPEALVITDETGRALHVLPLTAVLPESLLTMAKEQ
jgi:hypothetical protein